MSFKLIVLCQMGFLLALADASFARTITCTMSQRSNSHYIAPEIALKLLDYGEVSIADAVIASTGKKRIIGTISSENSRKLSVYWEVRNVPADPKEFRFSKPKLVVRLNIQKRDGAATLSATDFVQDNLSYRGTGVCRFDG
jgi:hypothetical protein